jgi:hypothetical protein
MGTKARETEKGSIQESGSLGTRLTQHNTPKKIKLAKPEPDSAIERIKARLMQLKCAPEQIELHVSLSAAEAAKRNSADLMCAAALSLASRCALKK